MNWRNSPCPRHHPYHLLSHRTVGEFLGSAGTH